MSTITKRTLWAVPLVLFGWVTVMAGVMRFSDAAPAAVVPFPRANLLAGLPKDVSILGLNQNALIVANRPGLTKALYEAGALIVLPAGLKGCLPLTKAQRERI